MKVPQPSVRLIILCPNEAAWHLACALTSLLWCALYRVSIILKLNLKTTQLNVNYGQSTENVCAYVLVLNCKSCLSVVLFDIYHRGQIKNVQNKELWKRLFIFMLHDHFMANAQGKFSPFSVAESIIWRMRGILPLTRHLF